MNRSHGAVLALRVVAVNVAVVLALLLLLEGGVRLFVPAITPTGTDRRLFADSLFGDVPGPRPHATGTSNGAPFRVDADGFWAYGGGAAAGPGWLFLGDSVTMGIGVDPDATFAGRLAARLDTVRLLNPSVIGYSSRDYRKVLEALTDGSRPAPRLARVTVFWCLNDVYAAVPGLADPDQAVRQIGGPLLAFLRQHVRTYQWLKALFFDRPRTYFEHDRRLYDGPAFDAAVADLVALHTRAAAHGLRLDVVLLPYQAQLRPDAGPDALQPQRLLRERLAAAAIPVHDPAPTLRAAAADPAALYLYGDGIHFSAEGHRLLADYLAETLW